MSFSTRSVGGAKENLIVSIPATDSQGQSAGATPEADIAGVVDATLFWVEIDCRDNPNENGVLRLYASDATPTVGTNDSEVTLRGVRGKIITYNFPVGIIWPSPSVEKMHAAYVKGDGATANSDNPTGTVKIRIGLNTNV